MTEPKLHQPKPTAAFPQVFCPRLEKTLPVDEHADCPFCFGKKPQIAKADHGDFCDFKPGSDPVNFGFPTDATRNRTA